MEVIAFQIVIVLSMTIARALSPRALGIAAVGWAVFTLALVFATPLIVLQLFVIWGAHSLLAPNRTAAVVSGRPSRRAAEVADVKTSDSTPRSHTLPEIPSQAAPVAQSSVKQPEASFSEFVSHADDSLKGLARDIAISKTVHEKTATIRQEIWSEKARIEAALKLAEISVSREKNLKQTGDEYRRAYLEADSKVHSIWQWDAMKRVRRRM